MRTAQLYDYESCPFTHAVRQIESKHEKLLRRHRNSYTGEGPDGLSNHFVSNDIAIVFRNDSYLPGYIQQEISQSHREVYARE